MDIERLKETLLEKDGLSNTLGMEFISTPEPDTCMARMKVDGRNKQAFGFLSGGATISLAETLAGLGSCALCPGKTCVGISVTASHVTTALEGDTVTALAHIRHKGKTLHTWSVDVTNGEGRLVSTVQITNIILNDKQ